MKDETFEAIIFDLDGTLIDSAPSLHRACSQMLAELGLPQPDLQTVIGFIGEGVPKLVNRCLTWAGAENDPAALARFHEIYNSDPVQGTTVFPGAPDLLRGLHTVGCRLGLCTNKPEAPTRHLLEALELGPFDSVAGGDTCAARKPDPTPLLHVVRQLGASPSTSLYVGDSKTDWRTAQAAGLRYIHILGGYESLTPPDSCWRVSRNLKDLAAVFPRLHA